MGAVTGGASSGDAAADREALAAAGWVVGVHNDYRLHGVAMTFWSFNHRCGLSVKGEGRTDAEALDEARRAAEAALPLVEALEVVREAAPGERARLVALIRGAVGLGG